METLLYSKPSVQSMWALFVVKFKIVFLNFTGYDLMFEASKKDIEYVKPQTEKPSKTIKALGFNWILLSQKTQPTI